MVSRLLGVTGNLFTCFSYTLDWTFLRVIEHPKVKYAQPEHTLRALWDDSSNSKPFQENEKLPYNAQYGYPTILSNGVISLHY